LDAWEARPGRRGVDTLGAKLALEVGLAGPELRTDLRLVEEVVGIVYFAGPLDGILDWVLVGVLGAGAVGGTTTQFLAISSALELYETCRRFDARGGVDSGVARSI
jgi:hypothetical protein